MCCEMETAEIALLKMGPSVLYGAWLRMGGGKGRGEQEGGEESREGGERRENSSMLTTYPPFLWSQIVTIKFGFQDFLSPAQGYYHDTRRQRTTVK